jgi:NADH dehydrogenase
MAVMVTGASGVVGRALIPALLAREPEVRAAVRRRDAAEPLRALGAKVTLGRLEDPAALAETCGGAFTLIHLVGGVNQPDDDELLTANHRSVLTALAAAKLANVHRFVLVSVPGASPEAGDPFLRAKGLAEEAVAASGLGFAIVRSTHAYGVGGLWFTATLAAAEDGFAIGDVGTPSAPVFVDDLADVLAAIDDHPSDLRGTWALEGPDVVTPEGLARELGHDARLEPVPPQEAAARLSDLLGVAVSPAATRFFARPARADAPDAASAFRVERTPLREGLRRTAERAASERLTG